MNKKHFLILLSMIFLISGCVSNLSEEQKYTNQLIKNGCIQVQIDTTGNTCKLNEKENEFNLGCTEMVTTQKLDKLKCIKLKIPNENCGILSGTMNEETYFASPGAVICQSNGCEIKERAYFPPVEKYDLDTGYYTFDCVEKTE